MLKYARNEQFKDETLGKTLINYLKAYDSPEVIKNRLRQNKQSLKSQEKNEEKLGLSVSDLNKQIKLMFVTKIEGALIERAKGQTQMTTNIMVKIVKKIKDSEAFLCSRSLTMITIRKENGSILEKLKSIKELMISLKEKMNKKKAKSIATPNNSQNQIDTVSNRSSLAKKDKRKVLNVADANSNLLSAEKTTIQNFMEKAMDEQLKEEEINQLNENRINFEKKLKYNNDILSKMEIENQVERKNLKETEKMLRNFLFRLLIEGNDCRFIFILINFFFLGGVGAWGHGNY